MEEYQSMNVLSKVKSDKRVVEVKKAIDSGDRLEPAKANIASGLLKKSPPAA